MLWGCLMFFGRGVGGILGVEWSKIGVYEFESGNSWVGQCGEVNLV